MTEERYKQIKDSIELQSLVKTQIGVKDELLQEEIELLKAYEQLKENWNKLKEYLVNDINNRNGTVIVEFEEGNRVSETISPIYTLMENKSKTIKEILDKMQELEQGSDE